MARGSSYLSPTSRAFAASSVRWSRQIDQLVEPVEHHVSIPAKLVETLDGQVADARADAGVEGLEVVTEKPIRVVVRTDPVPFSLATLNELEREDLVPRSETLGGRQVPVLVKGGRHLLLRVEEIEQHPRVDEERFEYRIVELGPALPSASAPVHPKLIDLVREVSLAENPQLLDLATPKDGREPNPVSNGFRREGREPLLPDEVCGGYFRR